METWQSGLLRRSWYYMIYTVDTYSLLPQSEATYLLKIGKFWYVGHTSNIYARAKYRKSRLKAGRCNERRIQAAFDTRKTYPEYTILSRSDRERYYFNKFRLKLGTKHCMNCLRGGNDVSSHQSDSLAIYAKISKTLKLKYETSLKFRSLQKAASKAAARRRMKPCIYLGKTYRSLNELAEKTGIPRGSVGYLVSKGKIRLLSKENLT